jgi:hypothetical protein
MKWSTSPKLYWRKELADVARPCNPVVLIAHHSKNCPPFLVMRFLMVRPPWATRPDVLSCTFPAVVTHSACCGLPLCHSVRTARGLL